MSVGRSFQRKSAGFEVLTSILGVERSMGWSEKFPFLLFQLSFVVPDSFISVLSAVLSWIVLLSVTGIPALKAS